MASIGEWTRSLLSPAPTRTRSAWIHWLAWLAAVASFVILAVPLFVGTPADVDPALAWTDLGISAFFVLEFVTRSGLRQEGLRYAAWRWFDFVAMIPVLFLAPYWPVPVVLAWIVLALRAIRLLDRSLGDGFVKRHALALVEAIEEEISDRVILKIMGRIEGELRSARFGSTAANALRARKDALLQRIYQEQIPDTGTAAKLAKMTGIRSAVERFEERAFDSIIEVVGSPETDDMIADIVGASLARARDEIGRRSWRSHIGLRPSATGVGVGAAKP